MNLGYIGTGTMGNPMAKAYVAISQSEVGKSFPIRVDGSEILHAEVVALPFYDPENKRQEL